MTRPLQNRVLATGEIVATPERGQFMGNRGILHDESQTLGPARWRHKAWIICVLTWKDWHRQVMTPNRYTELFFLDEAVALAAGHRPCALCQHKAYTAYRAAAGFSSRAAEMDAILHAERVIPRTRRHRHSTARASELPDGAIILENEGPMLLWNDAAYPVSPKGYGAAAVKPSGEVTLLTPPSTCHALKNGYKPVLHRSFAAAS